ncbi:transposase (plasmid) [Aneurinibacillus sp. Ricciae_BoGa-3]|uniref:RNA-guided endonuclease InsQ/TnpB family protein n=1 Tax=Aneurinibacillus sp. Ricciae_BoGa-3 TaxID=3022697 RepID=UPI00234080E1|nr:transposase [Aneurinibacillus sp. Ricciae_BoGa-3]WCK57235.1 transposase [Aneurinibacillus sp. Ricciae_BoGa-3]
MNKVVYRTQRQQLKHLSKKEYVALKTLCFLAKNLHNVALYNVRQHFFATGEYLRYGENYHLSKDNENYQTLNSNMAQQIIKEADGAFQSFFGLLKLKKKGNYDAKVSIPHYLPKDGVMTLIIGQIRIKENGVLDIPMSPGFKRNYGKVSIHVPSNLKGKRIKEIRILPKGQARFFEIQFTYEVEVSPKECNKNHVLAIDFGVDNLATCVTNQGKSFIIDGKRLKSINQGYNKQLKKMQSVRDKLLGAKRSLSKKEFRHIQKRNNRVRDYLHKTARIIMDYCIQHDIGMLVVGHNKGIKLKSHMGSQNNQTFVQIPTSDLMHHLEYLCEASGIIFLEQEERFTSKADFFADDEIPVYDARNTKPYIFSGKRISRGQYRSAKGIILNADCNGALNILRKSSLGGKALRSLQSRGNLDMPIRIRVS